jgi:hypothetical protein
VNFDCDPDPDMPLDLPMLCEHPSCSRTSDATIRTDLVRRTDGSWRRQRVPERFDFCATHAREFELLLADGRMQIAAPSPPAAQARPAPEPPAPPTPTEENPMPTRTCSQPGCDRTHRARGWCSQHYQEHYYAPRQKGAPSTAAERPAPIDPPPPAPVNPPPGTSEVPLEELRQSLEARLTAVRLVTRHADPPTLPGATFDDDVQVVVQHLIRQQWPRIIADLQHLARRDQVQDADLRRVLQGKGL